MSRALLAAGGGFASLGVFLWAAPAKDQRNLVVPRTALVIGGGVRENSHFVVFCEFLYLKQSSLNEDTPQHSLHISMVCTSFGGAAYMTSGVHR